MSNQSIRIGVVPIDDRPCNYDFFKQAVCTSKEIIVDLPPLASLGHFEKKGNLELLREFLISNCLKWDYLILSLDSLCYGGLVHAREFDGNMDMDDYFERLSILKILKKINPSLKILSYSVIIRLTTTVTENVDLDSWEKIFDYSKLAYLAMSDDVAKRKLQKLEQEIKPEVLKSYLNARKRNHVINLIAVDYLKLGLIDYLSIIQEDAQEVGIHLAEQSDIQQKIDNLELSEKVKIKNGTDELVTLLGARIINEVLGSTKVYLETNKLEENYIAKYEDRPLIGNIELIFEEAGIELTKEYEESDVVCFILNSKKEQKDCVFELKQILNEESSLYKSNISDINKKFVILDLQHANGGSIIDLREFISMNGLSITDLYGYSSWNTSSNSIGTITLDCTLARHNLFNRNYLENRIIDDALYQGMVRDKINDYILENNDNIWFFKHSIDEYTQMLNELMQESILEYPDLIRSKGNQEYYFPWNRTFEIGIEGGG